MSSFDILYGNKLADDIQKFHPRPDIRRVDICVADDIAFKEKRRSS